MAEFPGAIDYFVDESRVFINQNSKSAIVLHCTGGSASQTAEQLGDYFRSNALFTSTHYGIDRRGVVAQYVLERHGAAGNCCTELGHDEFWDQFGTNLNKETLSIECINDHENSLPLTEPQEQSLFKLVDYLRKKYNIPLSSIKSHASIAPRSRARCPGKAFPWNQLWAYLKGDENEQEEITMLQIDQVADYFLEVERDKRWRCKVPSVYDGKQYDIAYGLLDFYRAFGQVGLNGFSIFGLPTSGEIHVPGTKQAVMQFCERGIMTFDPEHEVDEVPGLTGPCYPAHIDQAFGQQFLSLPLIQHQSNKVVALQLELKRCLDTQAQEPAHQALHKIYEITQAFEQKEGI